MATPQEPIEPETKPNSMEKAISPEPSEHPGDGMEHMVKATLTASQSGVALSKEPSEDSDDDDSTLNENENKSKIPEWVSEHLNWKDLRDVLKCSLAAWAAFFCVTVNPILQNFGLAAFFGSMVCFFLPPSGIVFIYCLASLTMLIGLMLAWAWGCLTMKIAVAVRDDTLYNNTMNALKMQAIQQNATTPQIYVRDKVYEGALLQTNVTVVYFCLGLLFIYLMTRLRAALPKLTLTGIFGTLIFNIYLSAGPLNPKWNWQLPLIFIKPACAGVAVGLFCNIFIFPESCHHLTMYKGHQFFLLTKKVMEMSKDRPMEEGPIHMLKKKLLTFHQDTNMGHAFLPLEPSVGRWSPEDLQSVRPFAQDMLLRFVSILNFMISSIETFEKRKASREQRQHLEEISEVGRYQTLATIGALKFWDWKDNELETARNTMNTFRENVQGVLNANLEGIDAIAEIFQTVNCRRWWKKPSAEEIQRDVQKHRDVLEKMRAASREWEASITDKLLAHHEHLFDEEDKLFEPEVGRALPLHGIFLGLNFKARLRAATESLDKLLEHVIELEDKRHSTRLWMPTGLRHMANWALGRTNAPTTGTSGDGLDSLERVETKQALAEQKERKDHRKKVKAKSKKTRARGGQKFVSFLEWFSDSQGAFAFRVVIVTLACSIPGALKSSSGFSQREKFLWATIMAQLGLTEFMADFVLSYTSRFIATVIGGVLGMVIWYCGAGTGVGNPYGIMAMLVPFIIPTMFLRLYAPFVYFQAVIMGASTALLVVAYSWTNHYYPNYGNPDPGFDVFWHRVVLVVAGLTAALIVQIFPKPPSATKFAAISLGRALGGITTFYSKVMEAWISVGESKENSGLLTKENEEAIAELYSQIGLLEGRVALVKLEPSSSPFTARTLMKIHSEIGKVLESLGVVAWTLTTMKPELRRKIETQTTSLSMHTVADVMSVFTAVVYALNTGKPLPQVLPTPLIRKIHRRKGAESEWRLHKEVLKSRDFEVYVTGMMAYTSFLSRMDDLVLFTKQAVGEAYVIPGARVEEA